MRLTSLKEEPEQGQGVAQANVREILCGQILRLMGDGMECTRCGECLKVIGDEMDFIYKLTRLLADYENLGEIPQAAG